FSSRGRHTRWPRDWSSDVCSSDLGRVPAVMLTPVVTVTDTTGVNITAGTRPRVYYKKSTDTNAFNTNTSATAGWKFVEASGGGEIGRASCRERVEGWGWGGMGEER